MWIKTNRLIDQEQGCRVGKMSAAKMSVDKMTRCQTFRRIRDNLMKENLEVFVSFSKVDFFAQNLDNYAFPSRFQDGVTMIKNVSSLSLTPRQNKLECFYPEIFFYYRTR
jgi:hypothetical protein